MGVDKANTKSGIYTATKKKRAGCRDRIKWLQPRILENKERNLNM